MIRRGLFGGAVVGLAVLGLASMAMAQDQPPGADAKLSATTYSVKLVKAMDECTPDNVITTVDGTPACATANALTDPGQFNLGKLIVKQLPLGKGSKIIYLLKSSGASGNSQQGLAGKTVRLEMVLRVTRAGSFYSPTPTANQQVTWEDVTVDCPVETMDAHGNLVVKTTLQGCGLPTQLARETNNKEVVSAAIIDSVTGYAIAVPGVVHK